LRVPGLNRWCLGGLVSNVVKRATFSGCPFSFCQAVTLNSFLFPAHEVVFMLRYNVKLWEGNEARKTAHCCIILWKHHLLKLVMKSIKTGGMGAFQTKENPSPAKQVRDHLHGSSSSSADGKSWSEIVSAAAGGAENLQNPSNRSSGVGSDSRTYRKKMHTSGPKKQVPVVPQTRCRARLARKRAKKNKDVASAVVPDPKGSDSSTKEGSLVDDSKEEATDEEFLTWTDDEIPSEHVFNPSNSSSNKSSSSRKSKGGARVHTGPALSTRAVLDAVAESRGNLDAAKQMKNDLKQKEKDPEALRVAAYVKTLQNDGVLYRRNLGFYLLHHLEGRTYWSSSPVLLNLMQDLRLLGLKMEYNDYDPTIVLGTCPGWFHPEYLLLPAASPIQDGYTVFYDVTVLEGEYYSYLEPRRCVYSDADQAIFALADEGLKEVDRKLHDRFIEVELTPNLVSKLVDKGRKPRNAMIDTYLEQFLRGTKTYSELSFNSVVQSLLLHRDCPSYVRYFPNLVNDTLIYYYISNHTYWHNRVCDMPRDVQFDDRFIDSTTGVNFMGKSVSFNMMQKIWQDHFVPEINVKKAEFEAFKDSFSSPPPPSPPIPPRAPSGAHPPPEEDDDLPGVWTDDTSENSFALPPQISHFVLDLESSKKEDPENPFATLFDTFGEVRPDRDGSKVEAPVVEEIVEDDFLPLELLVGEFCHGLSVRAIETLEDKILSMANDADGLMAYFAAGFTGFNPRWMPTTISMLMSNGRFAEIYWHCCDRGRPDLVLTVYQASNLGDVSFPLVQSQMLVPSFDDSYWTPTNMNVSWQETQDGAHSFEESFKEILAEHDYDSRRIRVQSATQLSFPTGNFSEVHYNVYLGRRAICYGQDYVGVALLKRLGRSGVPDVHPKVGPKYQAFVEEIAGNVIPLIRRGAQDIITKEEYMPYLENMPSASRNKHLQFLEKRVRPEYADMPKRDSAFVKFDEVLLSPKGRLIINPPPDLFYELVVMLTDAKKTLKGQMFHLWHSKEHLDIYFSYGADMNSTQKSTWFARAHNMVSSSSKLICCFLVGGDDNCCLWGSQRLGVRGFESDVTACDQSHNHLLISQFLRHLCAMGVDKKDLALLNSSYMRPLLVKNILTIYFLFPQLHTGHPQTSFANTIVVGHVGAFIMSQVLDPKFMDTNPTAAQCEDKARGVAQTLGMIWKVQFHADALDITFHKGFWVSSPSKGYQWIPLPSCVWKMFKIRTASRVPRRALLERMAFNCYQRMITPNCHVVKRLASAQFEYLMNLLDLDPSPASVNKFVEGRYKAYYDRILHRKQISMDPEEAMSFDDYGDWSLEDEDSFFERRYGVLPEPTLGSWSGGIGVLNSHFLRTVVDRDFGCDNRKDLENLQVHEL